MSIAPQEPEIAYPPEVLDKYEIKKELGRGAFSVVKLGVNKKTKEKV